jgi:hypothetical protein
MLPELGPQVSPEPVVQGPIAEVEEAARVGIQDVVKLIAEQFERQPEEE